MMTADDEAVHDLLKTRSSPELAEAIRARRERIMDRWETLARHALSRADALPTSMLRDQLPQILDQIAASLQTGPQYKLIDVTQAHGAHRYLAHYDVQTMIIEFRLLRRVLAEEVSEALSQQMAIDEVIALDMSIDTAIQESLMGFLRHQQQARAY